MKNRLYELEKILRMAESETSNIRADYGRVSGSGLKKIPLSTSGVEFASSLNILSPLNTPIRNSPFLHRVNSNFK